jgi:hypothetical protein
MKRGSSDDELTPPLRGDNMLSVVQSTAGVNLRTPLQFEDQAAALRLGHFAKRSELNTGSANGRLAACFFFAGRSVGLRLRFFLNRQTAVPELLLFFAAEIGCFWTGTRAVLVLVLGWCLVTQLCPARYANAPPRSPPTAYSQTADSGT